MSSCDAFLQFVTPSDVRALKLRLDPYVTALDGAIGACPSVDPTTRSAWTAFATSWRTYFNSEEHWLSSASEFNTGCEYQSAIAGWQRTIGSLACGVPGPTIAEPRPGSDTATATTVRTVAIAAGVITVALTLRSFAR